MPTAIDCVEAGIDHDEQVGEHGRHQRTQQRGLGHYLGRHTMHMDVSTDLHRGDERDRCDGDRSAGALTRDHGRRLRLLQQLMADGCPTGSSITERAMSNGDHAMAAKAIWQPLRLKAMSTFTAAPDATRCPRTPQERPTMIDCIAVLEARGRGHRVHGVVIERKKMEFISTHHSLLAIKLCPKHYAPGHTVWEEPEIMRNDEPDRTTRRRMTKGNSRIIRTSRRNRARAALREDARAPARRLVDSLKVATK